MKIAVMGAGAVGCYYGARLHQAGHEVVLIGRPALVEAVNERGLRLQSKDFDGFLPLSASDSAQAITGAGLVLFCVKSGDTESAGAAMKPHLAADPTVLCLQNGVGNAERLTAVLGREAVPAVVYVATEMGGPGHVVHHGRGELVIGPSAGSEEAARLLSEAGVKTRVTASVQDALWAKLTVNCAYNALSALTQLPYGELLARPGFREIMTDVIGECQAVCKASGATLPGSILADTLAIADTMPAQRSSTAQDVARGRRSEIDFINGYVLREGERLGIATPVNRVLHALVRAKDDALPAG
ncbi:MAG: 2-dehydropantoate 2-reductase [Burkholderiaceae bacterium]